MVIKFLKFMIGVNEDEEKIIKNDVRCTTYLFNRYSRLFKQFQ